MHKKIWILNHYAGPPSVTFGLRHYNFAKALGQAGYEVTVFASSAQHFTGGNLITDGAPYRADDGEGVPFVYIRTRTYAGNGKDRMLGMLDFYRGLLRAAKDFERPDIILASSVHPLTCVAGVKMAKRLGVPCVCEIRDLWPESLIDFAGLSRRHPLVPVLRGMEKWIYRRADGVIFLLEGGRQYIQDQGWTEIAQSQRIYCVSNGVDVAAFDENARAHTFADDDLDAQGFFTISYTGSIRPANEVTKLVGAAEILAQRGRDSIRLLLYGNGDDVPAVKAMIAEKGLTNVIYKGAVNKKQVPSILRRCDANIYRVKQANVLRYGGSANKLFEYMAAGRPIVSTVHIGHDPLVRYEAGFVSTDDSPRAIADAIEKMAALSPDAYRRYAQNARDTALRYDFQALTAQLVEIIEGTEAK